MEYVCDGRCIRDLDCCGLKESVLCSCEQRNTNRLTKEERLGYQVLACELKPTYDYLVYHVKLAFEAEEVSG